MDDDELDREVRQYFAQQKKKYGPLVQLLERLAEKKDEEAAKEIIGLTEDPDPKVAGFALTALLGFEGQSVREYLTKISERTITTMFSGEMEVEYIDDEGFHRIIIQKIERARFPNAPASLAHQLEYIVFTPPISHLLHQRLPKEFHIPEYGFSRTKEIDDYLSTA